MLRVGLRGTECLVEKGYPHALGTADLAQCRRCPGLPFDHLSEQGEPHRDDLAVLGKLGDRLIQKGVLVPGDVARPVWQTPVRDTERCQYFARMTNVEEIDERGVLPLEQFDLELVHETGDRQPEIISHHHERLHMLTIAVPKSSDQLRVLPATLG